MKSMHKFTPNQVVPMEERALLSGFHYPAVVGSVHILPGQRGALVLTSHAYADVQATANTAIVSFEKAVIAEAKKDGWGTDHFNAAAFDARVGTDLDGGGGGGSKIGGDGSPNFWSYPSRTLLAALDAKMGAVENKLPFGSGRGAANPTFGAGLSNKTVILTGSLNTSSLAVGSVAIDMDDLINNAAGDTLATLSQNLELGRVEALAFHINTNALSLLSGEAGILPNYVIQFGSGSATPVFSLKNT